MFLFFNPFGTDIEVLSSHYKIQGPESGAPLIRTKYPWISRFSIMQYNLSPTIGESSLEKEDMELKSNDGIKEPLENLIIPPLEAVLF